MTIRAVLAIFAILGAQTANADTLSISPATPGYTVAGVASTYNTLAVRLAPQCGPRNSAKFMSSTLLKEEPVSGAFSATEALQPGTYKLCAYLFAAPEVIPHYPEPCSELYTAPVFCQAGEQAEATITVEPTFPPIIAPPMPAPVVAPITVTPVTPIAQPAKPKAPVSRKKAKRHHHKHHPKRKHHR
jgi:hypothetical protein